MIGRGGSTGDFFACPDCTGVPATVSGALRGMHSQKTRQTAEDPGLPPWNGSEQEEEDDEEEEGWRRGRAEKRDA